MSASKIMGLMRHSPTYPSASVQAHGVVVLRVGALEIRCAVQVDVEPGPFRVRRGVQRRVTRLRSREHAAHGTVPRVFLGTGGNRRSVELSSARTACGGPRQLPHMIVRVRGPLQVMNRLYFRSKIMLSGQGFRG